MKENVKIQNIYMENETHKESIHKDNTMIT